MLFRSFWSSFGGMFSWGVYLTAAIYFKEEGIRYFFAALFLGLYAEIFARLKKKPATVFLAVGFIPLIPGFSLYTTMYSALRSQKAGFTFYGIQALLIAGALASGIIVSLKTHRIVQAAQGRAVADFGARRAHKYAKSASVMTAPPIRTRARPVRPCPDRSPR